MKLDSIQMLKQKLSEAELWDDELLFNRWAYIKEANSTDMNLYFVEEGCLRVYFREDSYEHSLYFGYEGSLISALDSFFSEKPSSLIIQCVNKTHVKRISKASFQAFLQSDPEVSSLWQHVLADLSQWQLEREKERKIC